MEVARFCSTSHVVIVAGKGGVGKTTVTAALAVAAARRFERARRGGRGQIGVAHHVRRRAALVRRARPRTRYPSPLPHARRRPRRLSRVARDASDLQATDRLGRARSGRDRGSGHEGHPRAGQGEVARRVARQPADRRRAGRGPRHLVPALAAWAARRGSSRPDQQAGRRRRGTAVGPRAARSCS